MIRNVVFDMGQVLIEFRPFDLIDRLEVAAEDRGTLYREVFCGIEWTQLDRGTVTEAEAADAMCARLPERLHTPAQALVYNWWQRPLIPIPGMEALLRELHALGYGLYLLSNASVRLAEYFPRLPGAELFGGRIISAEWKLLKPQREIYEALYQTYSLKPAECFFVDDSPANVEGAFCTGMRGAVFFGDTARLRRELRQAGVPVSAE